MWVLGLVLGCADITPIEDGAVYGSVEVVQDWFTSVGLVQTGESTLLIDAGFREAKMKRYLGKRGVEPEDVDHVLLTHGHGDHVGALAIYTQAQIWAFPEESSTLSEQEVAATHELVEGFQEIGGVSLEAIPVPGHTPGSAVYVMGDVALLGDTALITRDGRLSPVAEKRSEDPAAAEANLGILAQQLLDRDVQVVVPSHSGAANQEVLQAYLDDL